MATHPQKGKGSKRPRRFHRGRAEGRRAIQPIDAIARAEQRAEAVEAELAPVRALGREETELWRSLEHVSPHVPELIPAAWL